MAGASRKDGVRYSITVKLNKALHKAIAAIPDDAWAAIPYFLDGGAEVAETTYRPFGKKAPVVRLIVRRVRPTPGSQLALLVEYAFHAFVTDREGGTIELEANHRRHAVVENTIRDLKYGVRAQPHALGALRGQRRVAGDRRHRPRHGPLDHPRRPGRGLDRHDTLRRRYLRVPGRLTTSARRFTLHLPERWPWAKRFDSSLANLRAVVLVT